MKVICIDASGLRRIEEGGIYNVLNTAEKGSHGLCYLIFDGEPLCWYTVRRFVPLSSIDETTFEREYKKETV